MSEQQTALQTTTAKAEPPRALVEAGERGLEVANLDGMYRLAQYAAKSGLIPKGIDTPEAALIAMQMGMEVGLPPMQAIQNIAVINGRPCLWGDAALAVVRRHPDFVSIEEKIGADTAVCILTRRNEPPCVREFTLDDAKKAQLAGKQGPWSQYPKRMLQMRARSWAMRDCFPDALKGIAVAEEVRDFVDVPARPVVETATIAPEALTPTAEQPASFEKAQPATSPQPEKKAKATARPTREPGEDDGEPTDALFAEPTRYDA